MKKAISLLMLIACLAASAQTTYFTLSPAGLIVKSEQSYVVIDVLGKKQAQLYNDALVYLNGIYANPDSALSSVSGELISINGSEKSAIRRTSMHSFDIGYTIVIRFKDGKIRVDSPSFKLTTYVGQPQELHLVWGTDLTGRHLGIYGKSGKLKSEKAKADIEDFVNTFIDKFLKGITTTDKW